MATVRLFITAPGERACAPQNADDRQFDLRRRRGQRRTEVGDTVLPWSRGGVLAVPAGAPIAMCVADGAAVLLRVTDRPIYESWG